MPSGVVRRAAFLSQQSCYDVLHFLMVGKPTEFDAGQPRSREKTLAEKLREPRAEPFALV
jgi:hypothetical protein